MLRAAALLTVMIGFGGVVESVASQHAAADSPKSGPSPMLRPLAPIYDTTLYEPVTFAALPDWVDDDHAAALGAFRASCTKIASGKTDAHLRAVCETARALPLAPDRATARAFFEQNFTPCRVLNSTAPGLLTAYYEPVLQGARTPSAQFPIPLHRRPADLVNLVSEADRAQPSGTGSPSSPLAGLTHARRDGLVLRPYATRAEIDSGALDGQGLELFFVADAVERFFLQVQGSGIIQLRDGEKIRVTYDGKNGHPYTSVGRVLIDQGAITESAMSLQTLAAWLRADGKRGSQAIWRNKSYVFFRALPGATAPMGVMEVGLTPGRSLAIDAGVHQLGLPVYVSAPEMTHITGKPFQQLMVAQDVGSAIRGRERGDIFAGTGPEAGAIAGITKHAGRFFVLHPHAAPSP